MDIRITGTEDDIKEAISKLKVTLIVSEVSKLYLNRGSTTIYRCYIKAEPRK